MSTPLPQLQMLLLDLLSTVRPVDPAAVAELTADEWETLLRMARQHRLLPLLHWRLIHERRDLTVPEVVRDTLAAGFRRSAMRALRLQRELLLTHHHLEEAGIPHIALKGAFLAFHAYPHPALRPMRDLDILVPETTALKAYQVLLEAGFVRLKKYRGNIEAAIQTRNHLPPLHSPSGGVSVELHTRFSLPDEEDNAPDLAQDQGLWQRAVEHDVAGHTLRYLSPTDLLLHLIQHAVYHHRLDNGPLVLSDIAYLLGEHAIDWPLFWRRVEECRLSRGAALTLKMAEHYFGTLPMERHASAQMDAQLIIETAALLTLRDITSKADSYLESEVRNQPNWRGKIRVFLRRAFPPRRVIATSHPVREESAVIHLWYIAHCWRLFTTRLPEYLARRRENRVANETENILRFEEWLQEEPAAKEAQ